MTDAWPEALGFKTMDSSLNKAQWLLAGTVDFPLVNLVYSYITSPVTEFLVMVPGD